MPPLFDLIRQPELLEDLTPEQARVLLPQIQSFLARATAVAIRSPKEAADEILTTAQAAVFLGLPESTLREKARTFYSSALRNVGTSRYRFSKAELVKVMKRRTA